MANDSSLNVSKSGRGDFENTRAYIYQFGRSVQEEIETRLFNHGKIASGELYESIAFDVKENNKRFVLTFSMAYHGQFVDKGVNGTEKNWGSKFSYKNGKPTGRKSEFISALQKWCQIKGIPKEAAYPIRKNIFKMGIAPTNFFTIPTTRRRKQFEKGIEKNMALDVEQILQSDLKKSGVKYKTK